ncbi:iron chelate uptake ABC transporter family permease subunit [Streptomyces sp. NPDC056257]|uniref:FecCD family ABC transporter permease n=1 Tax=Streptomyces sp. NPDC056257 TaxID=3345765 RepID=UPI0035D8F6A5
MPGRSPQGASGLAGQNATPSETATPDTSPRSGSDGVGCVSGRSPQGAERTAAELSDPSPRSASEETSRRAPGPGGTNPSGADPASTTPAKRRSQPAPGPAETNPSGADPAAAPAKSRGRRALWLTAVLVAALLLLALVSAGTGAYRIPTPDVLASVQHRLGLGGAPLDRVGESVLWNVRLPRVVLALLVGASLGCAGALMQGVFGNPLAEPGVIGISAGAAVGAVAAIGLGLSFLGNWTITVCAFIAGLVTVGSVYLLSRNGGKTEVVTLILTGIAVNAFAGALIGLFVFFADSGQVNQITFWQLGSLAQATWPKVLAVLPCALAGLLIAPFYARRLDLLSLGERPARHLGVDVERLRLSLILVVALLTAAAVAVAGVITFIGLLVPHLLRMANGPGHRFLVPGSALAGAVVLVAGDLAARTLAQPAELPLGVLTALIGSPFFFWLLRRTRRKQGGWA